MNNKNNVTEIKIYGKNSAINVKNFDSLDEFQQYYNLHKSEIDELSTVKLNRMYHIKDYKITRRKLDDNDESGKTLCFQQAKTAKANASTCDDLRITELENSISELNNKMKAIELENSKIKQQLFEIINAINAS